MTVTQVAELSGSRSKVYIDQEFAFVLYKGELRLYHIREGEEIAEKDYLTILKEVLPKRAKLRCMNLLQSRDYTREQLCGKLRGGYYPEDIIQEAVDYVASYHYIDDLRYAVSFITCHESSRSRRRIGQDLLAKGICRETLDKAWQEWEKYGGTQDEQLMICELLRKKHYEPDTAGMKEEQKIYGFLMRRGYAPEDIRAAIREYKMHKLKS